MFQHPVGPVADLCPADVDVAAVEVLPRREALALINVTTVVPINIAIAINAATFGSTAAAHALQGVGVVH
ncbi:MAG: hypothetical protein U0Q19_15625 [Kineosporiaceae bacterium]